MKALAVMAVLLLLTVGTVAAAEAQGTDVLDACRADAVRLCGADPGARAIGPAQRQRIAACMLGHVRQLSPPCRAVLRAWGL